MKRAMTRMGWLVRWMAALGMAFGWSVALAPAAPAAATPLPVCFAEYTGDNTTDFSSTDAQAVRDAVAAASVGGVVKLAGTCAGVSGAAVVTLDKALTLQGGYTDGAWTSAPSSANPTVLDALAGGRVITTSFPITLENLVVQNGAAAANGGGAYLGSTASIIATTVQSNTASSNGYGGGVYINATSWITGSSFISNTAGGRGGGAWTKLSYVTQTQFLDNRASNAGALFSDPNPVYMWDNTVARNVGTNGVGGITSYAAWVWRTSFVSNTGTAAGAANFQGNGYQPSHLIDSVVMSNTGTTGGVYFQNGGFVTNTTLVGNVGSAAQEGGGLTGYGKVVLNEAYFERNRSAGQGGAAYFTTAAHEIYDSTFVSNTAATDGGAIRFAGVPPLIRGSQFISNTSLSRGGAIFFWADSGIRIENTLFQRNVAPDGGAVFLFDNWDNGPTVLTNVVFASNGASAVTGTTDLLVRGQDGTFNVSGKHLTFVGSGVAVRFGNNTVADRIAFTNTIFSGYSVAVDEAGGGSGTLYKTLWDGVTKQYSNTVTSSAAITGSPDFVNAAAGKYIPKGAAVDAGVDVGVATDIDGRARPYGTAVDIGAYEMVPNCFAEYTGDNTTDYASLDAQALRDAVAAASADDVVKLAGTCAGASSGSVVTLDKALTLRGGYLTTNWLSTPDAAANPTVLDAQGGGRVISATAALTIEHLVVQNGLVTDLPGGGVNADGDLTVIGSVITRNATVGNNVVAKGGGIYVNGTVNLIDTELVTNSTEVGGGGMYAAGSVTIIGGRIERNSSLDDAGGVRAVTMTLSGTQVISNSSVGNGGALEVRGDMVLRSVTLQGNHGGYGGAIYHSYGFLADVADAHFIDNSADSAGAAAFEGRCAIRSSTFLSNTATAGDGGAFLTGYDPSYTCAVTDTTFIGNASSGNGGAINASGNPLVLVDVDFEGNDSGGFVGGGGAIYSSASVTMTGGSLAGNEAAASGGGLYAEKDVLLAGVAISTNIVGVADPSDRRGAGIFVGGSAVISGSSFISNTSACASPAAEIAGNAVISASQFISNVSTSVSNKCEHGPVYVGGIGEVYDSAFTGNHGPYAGGLHIANGSSAATAGRVERSTFSKNSNGGENGGAVKVMAGGFPVIDSTFVDNSAAGLAAAVYIEDWQGVLFITNSTFLRNSANAYGAVYAGGGLIITGSTFISNTSSSTGGTIGGAVIGNYAPIEVTNSRFERNVSAGAGGALGVYDVLTVRGSTFVSNTAQSGVGGAIEAGAYAVTIVDSTFEQNAASTDAGAVNATNVTISGSTFTENHATSSGGAVKDAGSLVITDSTFASNSAGLEAGALKVAGTLSIEGGELRKNTSAANGGAIVASGSAWITGTTLVENASGGVGGGGQFLALLTMRNSDVLTNSAGLEGGGVHASDIDITDSHFISNASGSNGGALLSSSSATVSKTMFLRNTAVLGAGAVYALGATTVSNSTFVGNDSDSGPATMFFGGAGQLVNNVVVGGGAAEYGEIGLGGDKSAAVVDGAHNTFVGSGTAVVAGMFGNADTALLTNTIFSGYALGVDAQGTSSADLRGVLWDDVTNLVSGTVTASTQVTGAADFENPAAGDYLATGDGVDVGVNSGVAEDIRGVARPGGAGYDMGAYEAGDANAVSLEVAPLNGAPVVLSPAFVSTTTQYTTVVPAGTSRVVVTATTSDGGASVSYTASAGTCLEDLGCPLSVGANVITVTVTAPDGMTKKVYTVEVTLLASTDAALGNLAIAPGTLSPEYVSTTKRYTATVPVGTTSVVVTATPNHPGGYIGSTESSAGTCVIPKGRGAGGVQPAPVCDFAAPETTITVTVYAEDGATTDVYVIVVTVADDDGTPDATLGSLTITPGTLTPAFVSTTTDYESAVANDVTSVQVAATPNDPNAVVTFAAAPGTCQLPTARGVVNSGIPCTLEVGVNTITITITASDGSTQDYVITITRAAPLTTIDRVWPGTGLADGGMPVQIFGTGFVAALTVTVGPYEGEMVSVPFTIETDGRIQFVMPPGTAGQKISVTVATAGASQTAVDAFTYVAPDVIEFDGEVGGVFTTTDGVVVTIPPQGVSGSFYLTMTPQPPAPGVPGNVLMYAFRLDAVWNGIELATLTNPVTITLPIDEGIFAIQDGERPWLYQWVRGEERGKSGEERGKSGEERGESGEERGERSEEREEEGSALFSLSSSLTSSASGRWILVRGQVYEPTTQVMTVALRPMGEYALSTSILRAYWFSLVPVLK